MNDVPSFVILLTALLTLVALIQVFRKLAEEDARFLSHAAERDPSLPVTAPLES